MVTAQAYLTALPATASFTSLSVGATTFAIQFWVMSRAYLFLFSLPSTANFTTLTVGSNAVATQSWVTSQAYATALPATAN